MNTEVQFNTTPNQTPAFDKTPTLKLEVNRNYNLHLIANPRQFNRPNEFQGGKMENTYLLAVVDLADNLVKLVYCAKGSFKQGLAFVAQANSGTVAGLNVMIAVSKQKSTKSIYSFNSFTIEKSIDQTLNATAQAARDNFDVSVLDKIASKLNIVQ